MDELPTIKLGKKRYFFDYRLSQLRNVENPHEFEDLTPTLREILRLLLAGRVGQTGQVPVQVPLLGSVSTNSELDS